jgi:hypothetical protein
MWRIGEGLVLRAFWNPGYLFPRLVVKNNRTFKRYIEKPLRL